MITMPARKKSSSIGGGEQYKRRFTVKGESKPFWSPKRQVYSDRDKAEAKVKRLKENQRTQHTRITKEKSGHRVWGRGKTTKRKKK